MAEDLDANLWFGMDGEGVRKFDGESFTTYTTKDGTARLWDSEGKKLAVLPAYKRVLHAEFSPDGSRIVTASFDHTARLWDNEGKLLALLVGHKGGVFHAEFNHDGSRILTASADETARIFRVPATKLNKKGAANNHGDQKTPDDAPDATPARLRFKYGMRSILKDSERTVQTVS